MYASFASSIVNTPTELYYIKNEYMTEPNQIVRIINGRYVCHHSARMVCEVCYNQLLLKLQRPDPYAK